MDVKTTFLNGKLDEEIYMDQPIHFEVEGQELKVCCLKHSIYSLKQSSRSWYFRFYKAYYFYWFSNVRRRPLCVGQRIRERLLILSLYVDNILLAGNDMDMIVTTKGWLFSSFYMKDIEEANFMLRVKILRDYSRRLIGLSQETYIKKIL